ncbi:thiamine transporter [Bacillus sp. Xin]|uniref:thiamine transporter n=1 Tax=unclassified Bacillus (in: firmicutes) TaxID=185979 RepID=UPI0015731F58|nr:MULTISPECIES: thiamine transporter [unclassified Bacillus (in: firmicutes)]MBC6971445.1 thiamine transporter [Bacillus sp. Xin]NSW35934.1 thiamine transporter [Bacillus sp. Xin1]
MKQHPKAKELLELIETSKKHDIELQSFEIYLFHENELEKGQIGYRYDKNKNSLISGKKGDWQESWIVIGYDTDMGDPIFVDIEDPVYPIYTVEKGAGIWEPVCIARSIDEIMKQF